MGFPCSAAAAGDAETSFPSAAPVTAAAPIFKSEFLPEPVIIQSVELLRKEGSFLCRVRSTDGAEGISVAHNTMSILYPIFVRRVQPFFVGQDARRLDELLEKIRRDFFLTDLSKTKDGDIVITNPEYKKLVDELVFSKDFANHYNNYIDLVSLKKTIVHWQNQVPQLSIMLKERDIYFKEKKAKVSVSQFKTQHGSFQQRINNLQTKFNEVEKTSTPELLYTDVELEHADDLDYLEGKVNKLAQHEDMTDFQEKIRIMKGINYWNAATDYYPRLWNAKAGLKETSDEISTLVKRIESLQNAAKSEFHYRKYANEIAGMTNRMNRLNKLLDSTIDRIKEQLILIAADELDRRFKGIDAYHKAFKFDVARVSDRIFINKKK